MRLKLDENLSRHLKPALADLGHDVLTAVDEGLLSRGDTEVAAESFKEGRMLFTLDVEFADLRKYPPGKHPGIVLFRPPSFGSLSVNRFDEITSVCVAAEDVPSFYPPDHHMMENADGIEAGLSSHVNEDTLHEWVCQLNY
jgi:predicted nuclease of predicted toxin-antitoxin system